MDAQELQLPHHHHVIMNRFVAAGLADERVVAAFLGGSYARGTPDAYSDLDLYLITTDEAFNDFLAGSQAFIQLLGKPVFLEDFKGDWGEFVFFIFPTEPKVNLGLVARATSSIFTVGLTGSCSIRSISWQEWCSPRMNLLRPSKSRHYAA